MRIGEKEAQSQPNYVIVLVSSTASEKCEGLKREAKRGQESNDLRKENWIESDQYIVLILETS